MRLSIRIGIYVVCTVVLVLFMVLPGPDSLPPAAKHCFGVFIVAIILWITQALPLSVTSLLVIGLIPLLGISTPAKTMSSFGSTSVFFIIGAFIMAAAIMKTGLSTRLAARMLRVFGRWNPGFLSFGVMLTAALLACLMPEHAVVTFMFPIVLHIAEVMNLKKGKSMFGKILFLSLAWGAIIGGVTTYLGGARNPLAIGILYSRYEISIGFFEWMLPVLPLVLILLLLAPLIMFLFFGLRREKVDIEAARLHLASMVNNLGPVKSNEIRAAGVVLATILAWIFLGRIIGLATIAVISAAMMFILRVLEWEDVQKYVNWGVIIMYGGAIVLGKAINDTKGIEWLAHLITNHVHIPPFAMLAVIAFFSIVLTEGISNAAVVAMMLPLAYGIGDSLSMNPVVITYAVAIPAGLAFCLPMGTPPNAICYSSGYYRVKESLYSGLVMNFLSWLLFCITALLFWPIIGLNLQ